ncbi:MAG: hypothetical protein HYY76_05265 [Acidobacteria bacterium]|nr:hypothetical protein [Acidobacteriota bacterium]
MAICDLRFSDFTSHVTIINDNHKSPIANHKWRQPPRLLTGLAFIGAQISSPRPENNPYHPPKVAFSRGCFLKIFASAAAGRDVLRDPRLAFRCERRRFGAEAPIAAAAEPDPGEIARVEFLLRRRSGTD